MHAVCKRQVTENDSTTANRAMRAYVRTARHPHTTRHGGMRTDMHVVSNLYQVVELDAVFNHGVLQRAPVNAGVGTNFNIIADTHPAELLDFLPPSLVWCKAKAISSNHDT